MKIKLNENLPAELTELFLSHGHDVHSVLSEGLTGRDDQTIFDTVVAEGRVLFTQDLDFSDLRKFKPGTHPGIILMRLQNPSRRRLTQRLTQILQAESIDSWAGCFVVIGEKKLRIRRP